MRRSLRLMLASGLALALAAPLWLRAAGRAAPAVSPGELPEACRAAAVRYPPPAPRVLIRKGMRLLTLYSGKTPVREYRIALGGKPEGDKEREGDRRTPDGEFYVCSRLEKSRFRRFLGLSYPGPEDARRGLRAGLITPAQHDAILQAHRRKRRPPWDTGLGGAIGLHGGGASADWTLGCIALENEAIDELFAVLPLGTPVAITPD